MWDFKHTLLHNPYGYRFQMDDYFTSVQNEANAHLFLSKLLEVYHSGLPYDAVVINRGGGSQTDFLIFDDFKIGLAIAKFPIPVITGIGHQKNETIADLMAHTNTKTPTKAAEFIITHNKAFEDRLVLLQKQIVIRSQAFLAKEKSLFSSVHARVLNQSRTLLERNKVSLSNLEHRFTSAAKGELHLARRQLDVKRYSLEARPQVLLSYERRNLAKLAENVSASAARRLSTERILLKNAVAVIKVMSPENILKKGFAIVKKNNEITSDPGQFVPESEIEIILRNKSLRATVHTNTEYYGNDFNLPESL
ncbi:exodeoxyribonuclease VII large subunit [Kaistella sp. PBT33-4]|uniref:exodeoxyribonuclease VII large subunit n=1 Tax=Kaistella sp. PBT33-4 TaxID=3032000 RepID=UPI0023D7C447|nr:exodeoxyribonuclease VII large subunit [Kaistella sp. PBT33-4]MDF0720110.1 exodeoxyribonuclease VII large subunit [Kaistella sp. PBT33-4]